MKRNAQWVGHIRRVVRFTEEQWRDPQVRTQAFIDARREATACQGEIIIKIQAGRRVIKVASIRCYSDSRGRRTYVRHLPGKELLDRPLPLEDKDPA